jgi:hypothetical protein
MMECIFLKVKSITNSSKLTVRIDDSVLLDLY